MLLYILYSWPQYLQWSTHKVSCQYFPINRNLIMETFQSPDYLGNEVFEEKVPHRRRRRRNATRSLWGKKSKIKLLYLWNKKRLVARTKLGLMLTGNYHLRKDIDNDARICPGSTKKAKNTTTGVMFCQIFIFVSERQTGKRDEDRNSGDLPHAPRWNDRGFKWLRGL